MLHAMHRPALLGALLFVLVQLFGCGGGGDDPPQLLASKAERRVALAAPANADVAATATKLFDFAEQNYAEYFPGHQTDQKLNSWVYRYYPSTGAYIAVIDWHVYVLGGPFGPAVRDVGEVTQFVSVVAQANQPPTVTLTSPTPGTYIASANLVLSATAADIDGSIAKVEFYAGATKIGEDAVAPFSVSWNNVSAGTYNIAAVAVDNLGARTTSAVVAITVAPNQAPKVSLTSPANGTTFYAPATVSLAASASDDGSIAKVEFYAGATKLGEVTSAPFTFIWTGAAAGIYSLTARATDNAGLPTTSSAVSVTVIATSPAGTLTAKYLSSCPEASGSQDPNFYKCLQGSLAGTQTFDSTKSCDLTIDADGRFSIATGGVIYSIVAQSANFLSYHKLQSSSILSAQVGTQYIAPYLEIGFNAKHESGKDFFADGGSLEVYVNKSSDPKVGITCTLPVPRI